MLDGYHRIFNGFALKEVIRSADIPEPALGVGFAENLAFAPLTIRYEPAYQPPVFTKIKTHEQASSKGAGEQVSLDQFPSSGYMGEMLGGF